MDIKEIESLPTDQLEAQIKVLDLEQNAVKILINSYYGASGNNYFYFYDINVAQSITLQGQDLIKFSIQAMNHFFRNKWHLDKELHRKLGIDQYEIMPIQTDVAVYSDTDSTYVWFDPAIKSIIGMPTMNDDDAVRFVLKIDEYGIKPYLEKAFTKYGEKYNTVNQQDFELENVSTEGIWLAKKNYILNVAYVDNEKRDLLPPDKRYRIIKGLENVKGSYPKWAREKLEVLDNILLAKGRDLNIDTDLVPVMTKLKEEYMQLSIDDISFNFNLNEIDKYIIDIDQLAFQKGIPQIPRGTAYHNYLVRKTKSEKYREITPGQKVKMYHCSQNEHDFDIFCYVPTEFPDAFAPPIDKDEQFCRLIINPMNRFLEAYGMVNLDKNLKRMVEIIKPRTKKPIPQEKYYPLYAIDKVNLVYTEIPSKFNLYFDSPYNIVGNTEIISESVAIEEVKSVERVSQQLPEVPPDLFGEYLMYITKYDLNTAIIPHFQLEKYIKSAKKKQEKKDAKALSEFDDKPSETEEE